MPPAPTPILSCHRRHDPYLSSQGVTYNSLNAHRLQRISWSAGVETNVAGTVTLETSRQATASSSPA